MPESSISKCLILKHNFFAGMSECVTIYTIRQSMYLIMEVSAASRLSDNSTGIGTVILNSFQNPVFSICIFTIDPETSSG